MRSFIIITFLFILHFPIEAKITLPNVISDGMVLQRDSKVKLWGKGIPNTIVKVYADWNNEKILTTTLQDGSWELLLPTSKAGGPFTISIQNDNETKTLTDILLGEVWICAGQSNMQMPIKGFRAQPVENALAVIVESEKYDNIRMFTAKNTISNNKEFDVDGKWQAASINTTTDFSAIGYFYALELNKVLEVPIGMINLSWGGSNVQAWMSLENLSMFPEFDASTIDMKSKSPMRIPSALYNGMFHPVSKYGVKGAIWYQGESNLREEVLYKKMFPGMVEEWRKNIDRGVIPFYYVQIAPYKYDGSDNIASALIREVQSDCLEIIPNSGMVVTMDVGDENSIHPSKKETISRRLSYLALANTYGFTNLPSSSPVFKSAQVKQDKMFLTFDNVADGFMPSEESIKGFEIAGEDNVYYKAEAMIKKSVEVEVWSENVLNPINVRYCFKNFAIGSLKDVYGLPVSSFRTDK